MTDDRLTIVHDDEKLTILAEEDGTLYVALNAELAQDLAASEVIEGRHWVTIEPDAVQLREAQ